MVVRGVTPDVVTDQTPAHDVMSYVPAGLNVAQAADLREKDPESYAKRSVESMMAHIEAMLAFQQNGAEVFDYGNNLRQRAYEGGVENAFDEEFNFQDTDPANPRIYPECLILGRFTVAF